MRWAPELVCAEPEAPLSATDASSESATVAPFSPVVQEKGDTQLTSQQQQQVCVCLYL